jgi:hypothetical protein
VLLGYLKRMSLYFRIKQKRTIGIGQGLRKEVDLWVLPARSSHSTTAEETEMARIRRQQDSGKQEEIELV